MVKPLTDITASPAVTPSESINPASQSLQNPRPSDSSSTQQLPVELAGSQLNHATETIFDAPLGTFQLDGRVLEPSQQRKLSDQLIEQLATAIKPENPTKNAPSQRVVSEAHEVLVELKKLRREYEVLARLLQKP
ncbi:hypothetical protein H0A36_09975 [Endozoicomonas sp. SM1973]|uniref:Uncharacterized protein n=1 Tax=Spartinivicinus marinus TaxID=2994442 RepID=A0A853I6P3_9GAMM|nr:hypothetical protein [Spartinivicinus marinus]MCX4024637.1 hypothetical protein [Spartinivicinus marinus]NYZ66338.1 hypothetical protein [Spartinivicinus marinus]